MWNFVAGTATAFAGWVLSVNLPLAGFGDRAADSVRASVN